MKALKHIPLIAAICAMPWQAQAQTKMYGVNVGLGKSGVILQDDEPTIISPIDAELDDFFQLGLDYMYSPGNGGIYFKSGLLYNARTGDNTALDYLRAPIGLDFGIGNTFQFIFGANLFASYLLAYSGFDDNPAFNDNLRRLQLGWGGNVGFGLDLSRKVNLNVTYQRNFDFTEVYSVETRTVDGLVTENFLGQDGFVRMGLYYKIRP